jgi:hypothetical protein
MTTGTIAWFGGHSRFGDALTLLIVGGVVSTTVTVVEQEPVLPARSAAWQDTGVVPSLYEPGTAQLTGTVPSHWSLAVAVTEAAAPLGLVHSTTRGFGHVTTGGVVSTTVTAVEHRPVLPARSRALHATTVVPTGYAGPAAVVQLAVTAPSHASKAAAVTVAVADRFDVHSSVRGAGQLIDGGFVSTTVTDVVHVLMLFDPSFAVHVTGVRPSGNVPDDGAQAIPATLQLSVAVGVPSVARPPARPVHSTVCGRGHEIAGGVVSTTDTEAVH